MVIYVIATLLRPMRGREAGLAQKTTPLVQARSQKFAMGGELFGGLGAEPPAAEGQWGLGIWGQSPQPPVAQGSGGEAPSARKFCIFFAKITSF